MKTAMGILNTARFLTFCFVLAAMTLLSGCVTAEYHPMTSGILATPGCKITAEDNSFSIVSGQEFQPPFQMAKRTGYVTASDNSFPGLVNLCKDALSLGAKRVRVTVPGRAEPLYGVLGLYQIWNSGTGPGSRSYRIEIPQQYIDAATGGGVSAVYETYNGPSGSYYTSWVLWLSDQPF